MAPENFNGITLFKSDFFAIGAVLFNMISGKLLFSPLDANNSESLLDVNSRFDIQSQLKSLVSVVSSDCISFLKGILNLDHE
jgi:hypothetical protein